MFQHFIEQIYGKGIYHLLKYENQWIAEHPPLLKKKAKFV
jgi:hypothetical protein